MGFWMWFLLAVRIKKPKNKVKEECESLETEKGQGTKWDSLFTTNKEKEEEGSKQSEIKIMN